jgi:hypothetical protein
MQDVEVILGRPEEKWVRTVNRSIAEAKGDYVLVCDGNGTFAASEITKLLAYAGYCDVVFGARNTPGVVPELRRSWVLAKVVGALYGQTLTDVGCCMWLMSAAAGRMLVEPTPERCDDFVLGLIVKALRIGLSIIQIPVTYRPAWQPATEQKRRSIRECFRYLQIFVPRRGRTELLDGAQP